LTNDFRQLTIWHIICKKVKKLKQNPARPVRRHRRWQPNFNHIEEMHMQPRLFKYLAALALTVIICLPQTAAANLILNFDDVKTSNGTGVLPADYDGFTWTESGVKGDQWGVVDISYYQKYYLNKFDFPSNHNAITNKSATGLGAPEVTISNTNPFTFVGAYFGTWTWLNNTNLYGATSLTVTGKQGDTVVRTATFDLTPGRLVWQEMDFKNIDTLVIDAKGLGLWGQNFLMDNFTYDIGAPVSSAPIPATGLLLGSGLLGLALLRHREKSHA